VRAICLICEPMRDTVRAMPARGVLMTPTLFVTVLDIQFCIAFI
jgi:hypothetical protein